MTRTFAVICFSRLYIIVFCLKCFKTWIRWKTTRSKQSFPVTKQTFWLKLEKRFRMNVGILAQFKWTAPLSWQVCYIILHTFRRMSWVADGNIWAIFDTYIIDLVSIRWYSRYVLSLTDCEWRFLFWSMTFFVFEKMWFCKVE